MPPPAVIVRGAGTLFTGTTINTTTTTVRIITTSTRIRQGFNTTRVIHGTTGRAIPIQSSGTVGGGGIGGAAGWQKTVLKVMKALQWISCILFFLSTTYSIIKYFATPTADRAQMVVTEVDEEKGFLRMIWDMHDLSGLILPDANVMNDLDDTGKADLESVLRSIGAIKEESGWFNNKRFQIKLSGTVKTTNTGTHVRLTTSEASVTAQELYSMFNRAAINNKGNRSGMEAEIKEKLLDFAVGEAYSKENNTCERCGDITLTIAPDQIPCISNTYEVKVISTAKKWFDDEGKDPSAEADLVEALGNGVLPEWANDSSLLFASKSDRLDFLGQIARLEWTWADKVTMEYDEMTSPPLAAKDFSFTHEDSETSEKNFDFASDNNSCTDPYYWLGALENEGFDFGDERWGITHNEWESSSDKLSEKTGLSLDTYGVPTEAHGPEKDSVVGVIRDDMWAPDPLYHSAHHSVGAKTYVAEIQPFVFRANSILVFPYRNKGTKPMSHLDSRAETEIAKEISRKYSYEYKVVRSAISRLYNNKAQASDAKENHKAKLTAALGSNVTFQNDSHGSWAWRGQTIGYYILETDEPAYTCAKCNANGSSTQQAGTEILQSSSLDGDIFYIGISYWVAAKKQWKSLADQEDPDWKSIGDEGSEWSYTDNPFTVPCNTKTSAHIELGDVGGALRSALGN